MQNRSDYRKLKIKARCFIALFMSGLVISGLTAFPISQEVTILQRTFGERTFMERLWPPMAHWISFVHSGLASIEKGGNDFVYYGTDWLAFGHIVIAICFLGAIRDPVKNIWVIEFGMIACILVIPTALICGHIRAIPFFWRLIDCSFGVLGIIPLRLSHRYIKQMENLPAENKS